jgi:3-phenylpropionate/cinnamic acid dioxygenase small subunit
MQAQLERLLSRQEIQELLARYARGVDRRDWNAVRAAFHPDATDDHGPYKGGLNGFMAYVERRHETIDQAMHFLGNCLIEFATADLALVETYFIAFQWPAPQNEGELIVDRDAIGRYVDRIERRHGEWKIARRIVVLDAIRTIPSGSPKSNWTWVSARRDRDDAVYVMRRELGLPD